MLRNASESFEKWNISFVCLVPEMAIYEAKAMCERLEKAGVRFALEELPEEKVYAYSNHPGRGGLSTRLRLNVHPDDCDRAQPIIAAVLKILP